MPLYSYTRMVQGQRQAFFVSIEGTESLEELMDKFPASFSKSVLLKIMGKAGNEYNQEFKKQMPARLAPLKKLIKTKPGKTRIATLSAGAFTGLGVHITRNNKEWDLYYLLYWSNYGTLENRAPQHYFQKRRRPVSAQWKGGIKPQLFAERAWDISESRVTSVLENDAMDIANKHIARYAV